MFNQISFVAHRVLNNPMVSRIQTMSVKASFLQCHEFGPPEKVLQIREREVKAPEDNEVLVKILVAPINPADINVIQGECSFEVARGSAGKSIMNSFFQANMASVHNCHLFLATNASPKYWSVVKRFQM